MPALIKPLARMLPKAYPQPITYAPISIIGPVRWNTVQQDAFAFRLRHIGIATGLKQERFSSMDANGIENNADTLSATGNREIHIRTSKNISGAAIIAPGNAAITAELTT